MLTLSTWAQKEWTLDDCLSYALEHNVTLRESRLSVQSSAEDVKGSRGALLPTLSASTNQSVGYRPWANSSNASGVNVDKSYYNGSYGINASWTVWNGNKNVNTLKRNKLVEEQQNLDLQTTANNIEEQIAQLYVQILYLTEAAKVSEQNLQTSKKNEERGLQMLEVGSLSKADVAQLTAQRSSDEYGLVEAKANIAKYTLQMKQLLELDHEDAFAVATPSKSDDEALMPIPSFEEVYAQSLTIRPEIKSGQIGIKESELSLKMAKAGYLPTISLTAGLGTSTNSTSSAAWGRQLKTNFDASAGVTLSVPLFDGRQTKTSVRKAKLQQEQAHLELENREHALFVTIEGYRLDAETNQQKFRAAIATEQSEQESYNLLQEQFNLGLSNIVELMTGKYRLLAAQQNKLQSKYMSILALQMLRFYQGEAIK